MKCNQKESTRTMQDSTLEVITKVAKADPEVTPAIVSAIIRACKSPGAARRRMVNAREAMEILGISRPTLRGLTRSGKLHEVKVTPRKTRFFLDEIEELMQPAPAAPPDRSRDFRGRC